MPVCVDANFPLLFLLGDRHWKFAQETWLRWSDRDVIVVPPLFHAEVTSIIRERLYQQQIDEKLAARAVSASALLNVAVWSERLRLNTRAFELASRFHHPKAYDAQYLAVADLLKCELWTADRKLVNSVKQELPWVHFVGDYA